MPVKLTVSSTGSYIFSSFFIILGGLPPLDNKMKDPVTGEEIDLGNVQSSSKAETRKFEVIDDSEQSHGVLTIGSYICPKCDSQEVYSELRQTRASDEPETRLLTCKTCKHGWREY